MIMIDGGSREPKTSRNQSRWWQREALVQMFFDHTLEGISDPWVQKGAQHVEGAQ